MLTALRRCMPLVRQARACPSASLPNVEREATETPGTLRQIEIVAYAADCRISGYVSVQAERLTDVLNADGELHLRDAMLVSHKDGLARVIDQIEVRRDELLAVWATGPRGSRLLRLRTRPDRVTIRMGPYTVRGFL